MAKPVAIFTISGEIEDFTRIDNLYRSLKREGMRLLKEATIKVEVDYIEQVGKEEI